MGVAKFYHLTQGPLEATAPVLLRRAVGQGWSVVVRGTDPERMDWLDRKLWQGPEDEFLPHGLAGGPHDARQPVLLTVSGDKPNDPSGLMAIDGAEVSPEEVEALERVWILFDGHDERAMILARGQWKALTGAGCKAEYWSEESGRWQMKTESG
ncbi:DNA polymerase III subunit chi [Salipiger sp.]|uniref:DNA polymerase III subunit chi n=1 Tax=Salipiger sp. TaxID=2078585 RepID=UPI003A96AB59